MQRAGTVGYWRFDEGEGDTTHDDTGRHYGKLFGPTWVPGRYGKPRSPLTDLMTTPS